MKKSLLAIPLLLMMALVASVQAEKPVTPLADWGSLRFVEPFTPSGTTPIVVWISGSVVETASCYFDASGFDRIICDPPTSVGEGQLLCESATSGGTDCVGWQATQSLPDGRAYRHRPLTVAGPMDGAESLTVIQNLAWSWTRTMLISSFCPQLAADEVAGASAIRVKSAWIRT